MSKVSITNGANVASICCSVLLLLQLSPAVGSANEPAPSSVEPIVLAQAEGHMHKAILKAVPGNLRVRGARQINGKNIDLRNESLSNIDEFDALERLMHFNNNFVKRWYLGENSDYKDNDELLRAMFDRFAPDDKTTPIFPTPFGKRVISNLAEQSHIDFFAKMILLHGE